MRLARLSGDAAGAGVSTPWCIPALPPSEPQPLRRPNPTTAGSVGADAPTTFTTCSGAACSARSASLTTPTRVCPVDDREAFHLVLGIAVQLVDAVVGADGDRLARRRLPGRGRSGVLAPGEDLHHDVAVGDHDREAFRGGERSDAQSADTVASSCSSPGSRSGPSSCQRRPADGLSGDRIVSRRRSPIRSLRPRAATGPAA